MSARRNQATTIRILGRVVELPATPVDVPELKAILVEADAISSRWVCGEPRADGTCQVYAPNRGPLRVIVPIAETEPAHGRLMVAARNALPELLARLAAAEAVIAQAVDIYEHQRSLAGGEEDAQAENFWHGHRDTADHVLARLRGTEIAR